MPTNTLKFGIIGCGAIAPKHAEGINKTEGAELVACADILQDKARDLAKKEDIDWYTDYQQMLKRDDLDAVSICTPSGMHSEMTVAAAEAGKHVLCEKPLDISRTKMKEMIDACRKADVKLAGVFQRRTYESSKIVRRAVQNGDLGKMVLGDAYLKYYRSQEYYNQAEWRGTWELDGGGSLMNQGIHGIDLIQWIMGGIESVYARTGTLVRDIDVEDTAVITVKYANGAFGVIEGTTSVYPARPTTLHLHGERGTIILTDQNIRQYETTEGEVEIDMKPQKAGGSADPTDIGSVGHLKHVKDLVDAVREDREPEISGEEAAKAVEVILAIYESSRTGKEVRTDQTK